MMNLQKAGGIAALVEASIYIAGFVVMATLLNPGDTEAWSSAQKLVYTLERKAAFQMLNTAIYVAFGVVLVVLAVALHERLQMRSADLMKVATAFGLVWSGLVIASGMVANVGVDVVANLHAVDVTQAASAWVAIGAVHDRLGGGVEIVGGIWVLLVSAASFRSRVFPRMLDSLGFVVGIAGILTLVPALAGLGVVFGLGQILWFAWIGILLLRSADRVATSR